MNNELGVDRQELRKRTAKLLRRWRNGGYVPITVRYWGTEKPFRKKVMMEAAFQAYQELKYE